MTKHKSSDEKKTPSTKLVAEKNEMAMIAGILEGSPDGIGVAVVRLECGCKKMAAVDKEGEPASKVIIYRDNALNICDQCKADNGPFERVIESFLHWVEPFPSLEQQQKIEEKVFGTYPRA
ncbi:MAG: hypothetical protein KJ950_04980 [Proteobacteria bacterium]|nr:hypothetical protein [Pseudomonadota bacterium]MBU1688716.1 hypothetical protein [Pseudomonadota bacterium]